MKNERGSALLTVLLMSVILLTLGLAIIAYSIGDAKMTTISQQDLSNIHEAKMAIEEATAIIQTEIVDEVGTRYYTPSEFETTVVGDFKKEYTFDEEGLEFSIDHFPTTRNFFIVDTTADSIDRMKDLSRRFDIIARGMDENGLYRYFKQTVYVSAIPSFLYFGVGSNETVTLNGSPFIQGDMYVGNELTMTATAEYKLATETGVISKTFNTNYPYFSNNDTLSNVYKQSSSTVIPEYVNVADGQPNLVLTYPRPFIDVDLRKTFVDKVNALIDTTIEPETDIPLVIQQLKMDFTVSEIQDASAMTNENQSYLFTSDGSGGQTFFIDQNVTLGDDQWLIVDGNLFIYTYRDIEFKGNVLVTGDIYIVGARFEDELELHEQPSFFFDSTMIGLGKALILDAQINPSTESNTFIMMTEGEDTHFTRPENVETISSGIELARINEFKEDPLEINAFLYTSQDATLYGVGSNIKITGGIFSKKDLTINAVRGSVVDDATSVNGIRFSSPQETSVYPNESRFQVYHNREVLTLLQKQEGSYLGLPRTDRLTLLIDRLEVIR
ncbi:hypothetical protein [Alkalihalobacillus sp. LMS39]|uniref:hypothetical protein n=1 Tax=Alkalihalobacillus sp. LMS39 TaxID=2924032 RepID=UPI001FB1D88C|nr:hypothetical protein [Alkalihalobacillus sp. LMS39]UOE93318.1 hypothetical protein MM271_19290 [Alkalihalobacillus sp. LMS39]